MFNILTNASIDTPRVSISCIHTTNPPTLTPADPGAVVVGVSCDPLETLVRFAQENGGFTYPLLSDEVGTYMSISKILPYHLLQCRCPSATHRSPFPSEPCHFSCVWRRQETDAERASNDCAGEQGAMAHRQS